MRRLGLLVLLVLCGCSRKAARADPDAGARAALQLRAGGASTCLRDGGSVSCWGPRGDRPRGPFLAMEDALDLAAGMFAACAIRVDRTIGCWHPDLKGVELQGVDLGTAWSVGVSDAVQVAVGYAEGCAVTRAGEVACWSAMQDTPHERSAHTVVGLRDATAVAVGMGHACALRKGGTVACWGKNESGNLGDGTQVNRAAPTPVLDVHDAVEIAAGTYYTCARSRDGAAWCWGSLDEQPEHLRPSRVPEWTGAVQLSLNGGCNGGKLLCARMPGGGVRCQGDNIYGQVGDGTQVARGAPVPVQGLTDAADLAVGCSHVCALRAAGHVVCWGDGETLGFGPNNPQRVPAPARDL